MSLLDRIRRKSLTADPAVISALRGGSWSPGPALGGTNVQAIIERWAQAQSATYGYMYRTQPAVRKVVHKIADNLSQMCPKLYERVDDVERRSANDQPAAETLRYPNPQTPADRFIYDVVADYLVYDNAYVLMFPGTSNEFPSNLYRWPVHLVVALGSGIINTGYRLWNLDGSFADYEPEDVMHWRGYNPDDPRLGVAPLETLRLRLTEDSAMQAALTQLSKDGLKGGHLERPLEAPELDQESAERLVEAWARMTKASPRRTPLLEEGMTYVNDGVTPKDAQALESRQATTDEVCDVYGVPRGIFSDNVTEEDRNALYSDVIAPLSKKLASVLDHALVQGIYNKTDFYVVFDLNEKLRGSPETRLPAYTSAAGRPFMTVNEVRSKEDLPPVEGGDDLTVPLNIELMDENGEIVNPNPTTPQLPAPNVMPPQDPNGNPADGSYRENPKANGHALLALPERLKTFYDRQEQVVKSQGGKFNLERWNRELAQDLEGVAEPEVIDGLAKEINGVTEVLLSETTIGEAFAQVRAEAAMWANDIDRARVMVVAQGLLDASEGG